MTKPDRSGSSMMDEMVPRSKEEAKSLDLVQRTLISLMITIVVGTVAAALSVYLAFQHEEMAHFDVVGLWIMVGVIGLIWMSAVLLINRRKIYHPLIILGLAPMIISWFWIFR